MVLPSSFRVPVFTSSGQEYAELSPASLVDLPNNWSCAWNEFGRNTNTEYQVIAKLSLNNECLGLIKFSLYPEPGRFEAIDIDNVEANPVSRARMDKRLAEPVGLWLIWYAITTGIENCNPAESKPFVFLLAFEDVHEYYEEKIGMECLKAISISPDEDGYAFQFLLEAAMSFCRRVEAKYGEPKKQCT